MNTNHNDSPFGELIYTYTRAQAVADGVQVEVTKTAQEAGIRFPMFLTRTVYDANVTVRPDVTAQDKAGRLWDIVWMTHFAIIRARPGKEGGATCTRIPVALYVRNQPDACPVGCAKRYPTGAKLVKLIATCGPLDMDDPQGV